MPKSQFRLCGCCGLYHAVDFEGGCRGSAARLTSDDRDALGPDWEEVPELDESFDDLAPADLTLASPALRQVVSVLALRGRL